MNDEEALVAAAQIAAQASVAEAQIEAQADVAEAVTAESGETERAQLLAQALQMRDDDRAKIAALESRINDVCARLDSLTLSTAVAVEQVAEQAAGAEVAAAEAAAAAASAEPAGIPELDTASPPSGGNDATPPASAESESSPAAPVPATARAGARRATRHQQAHAQRFRR